MPTHSCTQVNFTFSLPPCGLSKSKEGRWTVKCICGLCIAEGTGAEKGANSKPNVDIWAATGNKDMMSVMGI